MNKENIHYQEILNAFNNANLRKIEEKFGKKYGFKMILGTFVVLSLFSFFFISSQHEEWVIIGLGLIMGFSLWLYFKYIKKQVLNHFGEDCKFFIEQHEINWRAIRALIFFESIEREHLISNEDIILETIEKELSLKEFKILETPVFMGLLTVWAMLINSIFDKTELTVLWVYFFILALVTYFSYGLVATLRTEVSKMNDLKLFIHWSKIIAPKLEKFKVEVALKDDN